MNNVGSLRLLFASLVVLSHAPELVDGNRSRELLTRVFGTLSFGEVAVDGFFLLSGYLIIRSFGNSASLVDYGTKRVARIFPAFVVASLICILVVAPLGGGDLSAVSVPRVLGRMVVLASPVVPGTFAGLPYPVLDGAMWTIPFEFACYAAVVGLAAAGALRNRTRYAALLIGLAGLFALRWHLMAQPGVQGRGLILLLEAIRLGFVFCCGGAFFVFRDRIGYSRRGACLAAVLLGAALFSLPLAEPAFAILGGYLVFWFAFAVRPWALSLAANRTDPSYGLYLYAWPVQNLLIRHLPGTSPWALAAVTLIVAGLLGIVSWRLVERPVLRWRSRVRVDATPTDHRRRRR